MTPTAARASLETLPSDALRAALSRLSLCTGEAIYWASDFPGSPDNKTLRGAFFGLATNGARALEEGDEIKTDLTGLYNADGPYGDWTVTASFEDLPAPVDPGDLGAEATLAGLDVEALRPILSEMIDAVPACVILNADFATDIADKTLDSGEDAPALTQMLLFACTALKDSLGAGDSRSFTFDAAFRGQATARRWSVTVSRITLGA